MSQKNPAEFYQGGSLAMAIAIQKADQPALEKLIATHIDKISDHGLQDMPLLLWAATQRNIPAVQALLKAGATCDDTAKMGQATDCLLSIAAGSADPAFMNALLAHGANPDGVSGTEPPLFTTIHGKRWDRFDQLIKAGAKIDHPNQVGVTPMMELAYIREYGQVLVALKLGADPNRKSNTGASLTSIMARWPLDPSSRVGKEQESVRKWLQSSSR